MIFLAGYANLEAQIIEAIQDEDVSFKCITKTSTSIVTFQDKEENV